MNLAKTALACALAAVVARSAAAADPGTNDFASALSAPTAAAPVQTVAIPQPATGQLAPPGLAAILPVNGTAAAPAYAPPIQPPAAFDAAAPGAGAESPSANDGNPGDGIGGSRVAALGPAFVSPQPQISAPAAPPGAEAVSTPAADNRKYGADFSKYGFFGRLLQAEIDEFRLPCAILDPKWRYEANQTADTELQTYQNFGGASLNPPRRAPPSPWYSPPFPTTEYQGYPLIGVPYSTSVYPLMKAVYGANTPFTDAIKESRIKLEGWCTAFGVWGNAKNSNVPASYWITPDSINVDQLVFRLERLPDEVQQDHWDWGFRSVGLYGMDYRYTTAGGWFSNQLLVHNNLYGFDPVEQYFQFYMPGFLAGTDIRIGRWIACPDIECQYSVDNYLGSHSILFTYDTYTQTGIMLTQKVNDRWTFQAVLHSGTDMAPWYPGAIPTGAFGGRWVSKSNNDAFYTWANALNNAQFRYFTYDGQPAGHDNFNYVVSTWEHRFNAVVHTKTEGYYMWEYNAELGGTPSLGPIEPYGSGGGNSPTIAGLSRAYGVLNYTMFAMSKSDYFTVRNEWYRDQTGFRTGTPDTYSSHTIGISHKFNDLCMVRPEIGYYRSYGAPAFDNGNLKGIWIVGADFTLRW